MLSIIKPAFESSGKRIKMLGCLSLRRKQTSIGAPGSSLPPPSRMQFAKTHRPPLSILPSCFQPRNLSSLSCLPRARQPCGPSFPKPLPLGPLPLSLGEERAADCVVRPQKKDCFKLDLRWSTPKSLLLSSWLWAPGFYLRALLPTPSKST